MPDHEFPKGKTLHGLLDAVVASDPERLALVDLESRLSFRDLWNRSGRLTARLIAAGVQPGETVVVALPRSIDTVISCFAILRAGAVVIPIDLRQPPSRNRALVDAARARWALFRGAEAPECVQHIPAIPMNGHPAECPADEPVLSGGDDACLIFTSGSTGEPKGVRLSHRSLMVRSEVEKTDYALGPQDVYLFRTSPAFVGLAVALSLLAGGVTIAVASPEAGDRVDDLAELVSTLGVTFAAFSPRLVEALVERPDLTSKFARLRILRSAGEALAPELAARLQASLPSCRLVDGYGATETTGVITSSGVPFPTVRLKLAGTGLSRDAEGEIWVSTPMLATGYLGGEPDGDPKFVDETSADGGPPARWYRTGDRGRLSSNGHLTVLGRMDLQLNVDGMRAEPREIEDALRLHPSVADAAVRTHKDARGRECLVAYIVDRGEPATAAALRTHLSQSLPSTLIPSRFVRMDALPRTASGKVDRPNLPNPAGATPSGAPAGKESETRLLPLFREVLRRPDLGVDDDFFEWGGDSLKSVALMARVDEAMGIRLSAAALLGAPTVRALSEVIARGSPAEVATVWLREEGGLPPLICLPGLAGDPMWFFPLIEALDRTRPLLGLSFVGLKPPITILSAAARAVASVRIIQPRGPYFLLGHSIGGVLAFEMARQLQAAGENVAFIGLIDTFVPGKPHPHPSSEAQSLKRGRNLRLAADRAKEDMRALSYLPGLKAAAKEHRVAPCDLAVTLFRASERSVGSDLPGDWKPIARRGVEVVDIPGHHFDMVGGGRAKELSARVVEALSRATSGLRESSSPSS